MNTWENRVGDVAELLVWVTLGQDPTLGSSRFMCVDGPAGSGKTSLAEAMLRAASGSGNARLLHMDDMYEGWSGLGDVSTRVARDLVRPLRDDNPGRYQRFDWHREAFAEWHTVEPCDLLILEGCGSGAAAYDDAITTLVWVEAPRDLRVERGIARDGADVLPNWLEWMDSEDALFTREQTRERSDVVVDGTGEADPAVVFG